MSFICAHQGCESSFTRRASYEDHLIYDHKVAGYDFPTWETESGKIIINYYWKLLLFLLVLNILTQWMCNAMSSYLQGPGSFPGSNLTFLNERRFVTVLG